MSSPSPREELSAALAACRRVVLALSAMSCVINLLALTGSIYMLQVYDRVLTSHSVPTLVALSVLALVLYFFMGLLDVLRAQVLVRLASGINLRLTPLAHRAATRAPLLGASTTEAAVPVRDVDTIRGFVAGQGPIALLDLPWMPIYLAFAFLLHPWLGWLSTVGVLILVALTLLTERRTSALNQQLAKSAASRNAILDNNLRNAEVIRALGMGRRSEARYEAANSDYLALHAQASDITGGLSGVSKVLRMLLQSGTLGLGAYLVLQGEMSGGAIIAGSIASSRALAPIELAIGQWKNFVAARQSYARLKRFLEALPAVAPLLHLPAPRQRLTLEGVTVAVPNGQRIVVSGVNLELAAGQGLGIIGASAAGKSSLARAITGIWPLVRGNVRLDGATTDRWNPDELGRHIGYLPQDVELLDGTIAENISRFVASPDSAEIIAAARAADVHDMILRLPSAYDTRVGPGGSVLSAGQRQRIALARALYRDPFLVVLDEPNSNLDSAGEAALARAIAGIRERGGTVIVVAHRQSALTAVDLVGVMSGGQLTDFGPKEAILGAIARKTPLAAVS